MPPDPLIILKTWGRMRASELQRRMGVSRATMMRAIRARAGSIIVRGNARRAAYAARRKVRGSDAAISLFRIDEHGLGARMGALDPVYPQGAALLLQQPCEWPLPEDMADGWFDGLPYLFDDMRPQGFIGRSFSDFRVLFRFRLFVLRFRIFAVDYFSVDRKFSRRFFFYFFEFDIA